MENEAFIALGSNIGDRASFLSEAIQGLRENPHITVEQVSSIYETAPVGYTEQASFLNMVARIKTGLNAHDLLDILQDLEQKGGRTREIHWGPRTLDLDILLYNQENIVSERLILPHPRMWERGFVMIPLAEIDSSLRVPITNEPISAYIDKLEGREGVRVWKQKNGEDEFELFEN
ncbi:2-amino-4-hydroxy-6-hydroxymethyldihydropteridine diphosphokinase [Priestia koreensis]|uniref:2-amino-4-hydroxy-6-hydroxymethyldihydropteridine diphosphokinase n=1 Tax=Priestia koreensis TaxID=284581 RepID=A0A0M0KU09_9BACI|nr:2-amino-4-hydroxy-6-hydroxymethyldihydropteridine diphosphokinase [Priestia koreensis]KOO42320.1 2-amino-4-hydroxy-6-hydroxymethyldihydropteridine pyrophosphokinase [Priestia koreensis]